MMNLLPLNTELGTLVITEIYAYYDEPKLFCVTNSLNSLYVVYWCDQRDDGAEGWLYLPISEIKLESIRQGQLSIGEAFLSPEENGLYHVYTPFNGKNDSISFNIVNEIDKKYFPPGDYFINYSDIEFIELESKTKIIQDVTAKWNHEVSIRKNNRNTYPSSEAVTSVIYLWTDIIQSVMCSMKKNQTIFPVMARPGSFKIKFDTANEDIGINSLLILNDIFKSKENLVDKFYKSNVEPYKFKQLFEISLKYKLNIEILTNDKNNKDKLIQIDHTTATEWIKLLEPLALKVLGTSKIPQANNIEKVVHVLELKRDGIDILPKMINVNSDRQVLYYINACYTLGLLTRNGFLTSQGRFLLSKERNQRLVVMSDRFESSDFGWAWITWSNVNSMLELNPNSAIQFLREVVPGLSENTIKRRATTLMQWLETLKPYHRDF